MTVVVLSNPKSFVNEAVSKNITYDLLNEAVECIGAQAVVRMFVGKSTRGSIGCLSSKSLQNWLVIYF